MTLAEISLVQYTHPDCEPMKNIMRLPREEAFGLAKTFADAHSDVTAFGRFADFDRYYALRLRQDAFLLRRFRELGGKPETKHPLSFVLEGSEYLKQWFSGGYETVLPMSGIDRPKISFTVGDSGSLIDRFGTVELYTYDAMDALLAEYGGELRTLLREKGRQYVEAQLWTERPVPASP